LREKIILRGKAFFEERKPTYAIGARIGALSQGDQIGSNVFGNMLLPESIRLINIEGQIGKLLTRKRKCKSSPILLLVERR